MKSFLMLIGFIIACFAIAGVGGYVTSTTVSTWYPTLQRPDWTPSGRTIGMVWNVLFFLMAISGWLIWKRAGFTPKTRRAFTLYAIQLALNLLWSICFFGLKSPGLALVEIVFLELAIIGTMVCFWRIQVTASRLLFPYAAWVVFAGVLNYLFWSLNNTGGASI